MLQCSKSHRQITPFSLQIRPIADQVAFLASPRSATMTGQAISVCGDTAMLG